MMMKGDKTTTSIDGSRESSEENDSTRFPTDLTGLARQARIEYPGAIDHVMERGDRRERSIGNSQNRDWTIRSWL